MINNLLEYSKLKSKKVEMTRTSINLIENVRCILKMHYFKAKEKENNLKLLISENFPRRLIADE